MYRILSHTADIGLEIAADSLEELFREAARGWKHLVLEHSPTRSQEEQSLRLASRDLDDLLVRWLGELNFWLCTRFWVLHQVEALHLSPRGGQWHLRARLSGEAFDPARHNIHFEIKAVTYHQLHIEQENGTFRTRVIFDI